MEDVREDAKKDKPEGSESSKEEADKAAAKPAASAASKEADEAKAKAKAAAEAEAEDESEEDDESEDEEDEDDDEEDDERVTKDQARAIARREILKRDVEGETMYAAGVAVSALPLRNISTIMRRELRSYFDSLVAYIVLGGSMLAIGVWFFLVEEHGFWQVDRASMTRMFDGMPWALCALVIPLVTMRSLAEEKRTGTLELLITLPIRDSEVIMGKYLAAFLMTLLLFASSLLYPVLMFWWPWHLGPLDWGPIWAAYLGLTLFSAAGVAIGMLFSSITESQIIAFFLTAVTLLFLQITGLVVESVHGWLGDAIAFVSFQSRFAPFARGLVDTRAVLYFLSITVLALIIAFRSLESRKWS